MRLAIMQPYFFPYVGYWSLIASVDKFIILDDVAYINRGWINRNRVLVNGSPTFLTVPLKSASQNKRICDISLAEDFDWRGKIVKTICQSYAKSPAFDEVFPVVERLIKFEENNLVEYLSHQLQEISKFLGINTTFDRASISHPKGLLSGQDRIIDICRQENASVYINLPGGRALYDAHPFSYYGVELRFVDDVQAVYKQRSCDFFPFLSIIDLLMELGPKATISYVKPQEHMNTKTC